MLMIGIIAVLFAGTLARVGPPAGNEKTDVAKYGSTRTDVRLGAAAIALSALIAGALTATASAAPAAQTSRPRCAGCRPISASSAATRAT